MNKIITLILLSLSFVFLIGCQGNNIELSQNTNESIESTVSDLSDEIGNETIETSASNGPQENVEGDNPYIFAYCYTQLTDVEQEQNGLLTYDRRFKFAPERYARIFGKKAIIE